MIKTQNSTGRQAGFGMSVTGRVRAYPITGPAASLVAGQKCALIPTAAADRPVAGTDVVVVKGSFMGTSAWSPPN